MTIQVKLLKVGQLRTNCYLVTDDISSKALIIDPGDGVDFIQRKISDEEVTPTKIIATHGHFDHILAVNELKLAYNIPFLMHKNDEFLLERMRSSCKFFTGYDPGPPPTVDGFLTRSNPVKLGKYKFKTIQTPGHTPGGISLYSKKEKVVFVGDLMFERGGVGRTDFSYSSKSDLDKSIEKILKLPNDTEVYSGHGESFLSSKRENHGFIRG